MTSNLHSGLPRRAFAALALMALFPAAAFSQLPARAAEGAATLSVKDFEVRGDGAEPETAEIQGAVDACAAAGGCTLLFPPGRYVTGTIFLRDAVHLHLAPGAVVAASRNADDYPAPALLYGKGLDSVTITGPGEIQGAPVPSKDPANSGGSRITALVLVENSSNVRIRDMRISASPAFTIALRVVDAAWVENIAIENPMAATHTSGVVVDSSTRVHIRGLHFRGGGEGIVFQSSLVDGIAPACERNSVSDSTITSGAMGIRVGSRTHGDIRQLSVSNVVIADSQGGVGIFGRDGGTVEDIQFSNLVIGTRAVHRDAAEWPIVLDLKRRDENSQPGAIQGIRFQNVQVRSAGRILFSGMTHHPIRDLQIEGLRFSMNLSEARKPQYERPWKSPLDQVSGEDRMATAILAGYLASASFRDVAVTWTQTGDLSPEGHSLFLHSSDGVRLDGWHARQAKTGGDLAAIEIMTARGVEIRNSTAPPETGIWLQLRGMARRDVYLSGNQTDAAYKDLVVAK